MYKYRRVIISVIALLLAAAILTGLLVTVFAANSADIRTEISGLESKQDELDQKKQELEAQIAANNTQTLNVVEQKAQIDQEIELTRQEVENLNEQIRQYNLLIAEKQAELDQLQTDQNDLLDRYKQRIRAMQEQGDVSYWSIIFGAKTFSRNAQPRFHGRGDCSERPAYAREHAPDRHGGPLRRGGAGRGEGLSRGEED